MKGNFTAFRVVMATFFLTFSCLPAFAAELTVGKGKTADFKTIQEAVNAAQDVDTITVSTGTFDGATVTKNVTIKGSLKNGKPGTQIKSPKSGVAGMNAGFVFPGQGQGSGATITQMNFQSGLDFPVYSKGADNVTVTANTMTKPVQGITNLNGSKWSITQNTIADLETVYNKKTGANGGGMGIFIGTSGVASADNNTIRLNTIKGTMKVNTQDPGSYMGCAIGMATHVVLPVGDTAEIDGILAFTPEALATAADNATDNKTVAGNKIDNNTISVKSQHGDIVEMYGIGMYELGNITGNPTCDIANNTIITGGLVTTALALTEGPVDLTTSCNNQADVAATTTAFGMKPLP